MKSATEAPFATLMEAVGAYIGPDAAEAGTIAAPGTSGGFVAAADSALAAWAVSLDEIDRLITERISGLVSRLNTSLLVTGILGALSILVAILIHRHMVRPLQRFAEVARTISQTKDYSLRVEADSHDEIGRLAVSLNEMLAEIAGAHEREMTEQSELARVTRLTTMGAHDRLDRARDQPAARRDRHQQQRRACAWLGHQQPDLDEARAALKRIVSDGHRASQVIGSIRAMFRKDGDQRSLIVVNDLIDEVLPLAQGNLQRRGRFRRGGARRRRAAGSGRPRAVAAGASQPDLERRRRHGRGDGPAADPADPIDPPRRSRRRADHRDRRRHRHREGLRGAHLPGILHDQVERHGHGIVHLPVDRRKSRRTTMGDDRAALRVDILARPSTGEGGRA